MNKTFVVKAVFCAASLLACSLALGEGVLIQAPLNLEGPCAKEIYQELKRLDPKMQISTGKKFFIKKSFYFKAYSLDGGHVTAVADRLVYMGRLYRYFQGDYIYDDSSKACSVKNFRESTKANGA